MNVSKTDLIAALTAEVYKQLQTFDYRGSIYDSLYSVSASKEMAGLIGRIVQDSMNTLRNLGWLTEDMDYTKTAVNFDSSVPRPTFRVTLSW